MEKSNMHIMTALCVYVVKGVDKIAVLLSHTFQLALDDINDAPMMFKTH